MKKIYQFIFTILFFITGLSVCKVDTFAEETETHNYEIAIDRNDDENLTVTYHIEESYSSPQDEISIYVPASIRIISHSYNISETEGGESEGELTLHLRKPEKEMSLDFVGIINLDDISSVQRDYISVSFPFKIEDCDSKGESKLTLRWNEDQIYDTDSGFIEHDNGYYTWEHHFSYGATYEVYVKYPVVGAKSFHFTIPQGFIKFILICFLFMGLVGLYFFLKEKIKERSINYSPSNLKRMLVKYSPTCKSCGAKNENGSTKCEYCGSSLFASSRELTEKEFAEKIDGFYKNENGDYISKTDSNLQLVVTRNGHKASEVESILLPKDTLEGLKSTKGVKFGVGFGYIGAMTADARKDARNLAKANKADENWKSNL